MGLVMIRHLLFICSLILSGSVIAANFSLDKAHSSIEFSVKHLGLVPVKGRFTKFEGGAKFDDVKNKVVTVYLKIDTDSVDTGNGDRDAHLKNKDFFHVRDDLYNIIEKNRYIEFKAENISIGSSASVKGDMKILNTKKKVSFKVNMASIKSGNTLKRVGVVAEGKIDRNDFGLTWQKPTSNFKSKLAGKLVGDTVKMTGNLTFIRSK